MKISKDDFFNPNCNIKSSTPTVGKREEVYYTMNGLSDVEDDDGYSIAKGLNDSFAYKICNPGRQPSYFVRFGYNGHLSNPKGGDYVNHPRNKKQHEPKFVKVKKQCFDYYIFYLKTKNENYLRNAEREAI